MANMEFLVQNYFDTNTMFFDDTGGNTSNAYLLYDRDTDDKFNPGVTGGTKYTLEVTFDATQSVSRIAMQGINLKDFSLFVAIGTATVTGVLTILDANTTVSNWNNNSDTAMYLKFATVQTTKFQIVASQTIASGELYQIGQMWFTDKDFSLTYNPDADGYSPKKRQTQYKHKMSDGGTALYKVDKKFMTKIKLDYVSQTVVDELENIYDQRLPFVFCPFPTGTSWDGKHIYEANWPGDFKFYKYTHHFKGNGFSGDIVIEETPN